MSVPRDNPAPERQESDVNVRVILALGAGLLLVTVIVGLSMVLLSGYFSRQMALTPRMFPLAAGGDRTLPPEPRLQTTPRQDLRELHAREDAILRTYGWVDKGAGIARIPIDVAMTLTVQSGLPAREAR
jgi:hypothetical protein